MPRFLRKRVARLGYRRRKQQSSPSRTGGFLCPPDADSAAERARCVIDASGEALSAVKRCGAYLIKPNLRELGDLAGADLGQESAQEKAVMSPVRMRIAEAVVVSLGASGALLATAVGCERFWAPAVVVRSPIGAGDSMTAGIVLALARGWELSDAVRYGIAAGTAAAMTPGTELCRRRDVETLYRKMRRTN